MSIQEEMICDFECLISENAFFIHLTSDKKKLSLTIKKTLKKTYGCHWNDDEKKFSGAQKNKIAVETLLRNHHISFSLINGYDPYFDLSPSQQKQERLSSAKDFKSLEALQQIIRFHELIKDYNQRYKTTLKTNEFSSKSLEELCKNIETADQKKYIEFLLEEYQKIYRSRKEVGEIGDKIEELNEQRYGNYVLELDGLYYWPKKSESNPNPERTWISSPILPEAYLRDKEGKSHALLIKVHDGERNHKIAIPRKTIAKWAELSEILLDLGQKIPIAPVNQKRLQDFLIHMRPEKLMRCVDKSGWHGDQYIFPDGEVFGLTKDGHENVHPMNEVCPKGIEKKGSLKEWRENILKLCSGNSRLIFSLGVPLSAPCLQLVGDEGGVFNFKGNSSIGKTRCLMVAMSVFGSPEFKRSWRTTSNGLEGICSLHNDCLLALDEFGQSDAKEIGEIAYMYSQGIGKQRSNQDGSPREPKTWRGMLFSTGEVGISDHVKDEKTKPKAGQLVRVIDIPAQVEGAFGCFEELHGFENGFDGERFADRIKEVCGEYYGVVGREFIKSMIEYGVEKSKKYLKSSRDHFAADVAGKFDGQVKRVANRFGLVYAALSLGIELGILSQYLTKEMAGNAVRHCFSDWLNDRGTAGNFESHSIISQVVGLLNENSDSKFISRNDVDDNRIRTALWGYKDGAIFYVFPKAFKDNLCYGYDEQNSKTILKAKGLLISEKKGKFSQSVRIAAHRREIDITS